MSAHTSIDPFSTMLASARRVGFIGPAAAAVMAGTFGWSQGSNIVSHIGLAICFGACSLMVGYGLVFLRRAWRLNMGLATYAIAGMLCVGVVGEFVAHLGFFAAHRQATNNAATVHNASYARTAKAETEAATNADALRAQLAAFKLTRSKAEAEADLANAQAHKWWAKTNSCKETFGPDTRAYCTKFFAAQADVARSDQRDALVASLAAAESKLDGARGSVGGIQLVVAHADAQTNIIAAALTGSMTPDKDAVFWTNILLASLAALVFLSFGALNMVVWEFAPEALEPTTAAKDVPATATPAAAPVHAPGLYQASLTTLRPRGDRVDTNALKTLASFMSAKAA